MPSCDRAFLRASFRALVVVLSAGYSGGLLAPTPAYGQTYMWQVTDQYPDIPVVHLRVTEVYQPLSVRLEWDWTNWSALHVATFDVKRTISGVTTTLATGITDPFYVDSNAIPLNTRIDYTIKVYDYEDLGLPPPPPGVTDNVAHLRSDVNVNPAGIHATIKQSVATDNQTVDSRYDPRYSTFVFKDFQFKTGIYRGGLYAGYQSQPDASNVGRSFLKFQLPVITSNNDLWCGSVNAFYTRSFATSGSTTVGCQKVDSGWDGSTLKWSTAPSVTPASATKTVTLTYDGTLASAKWCHFMMNGDIALAVYGSGAVSFALASTNEAAIGWAYFAKTSYRTDIGVNGPAQTSPPQVLYAYGGPLLPLDLTLDPVTLTGGASSTGTVTLSGLAPTGGAQVTLTPSNPSRASVPSSITIPSGQLTGTFTITTTSGSATTVTITASYGGYDKAQALTINQ